MLPPPQKQRRRTLMLHSNIHSHPNMQPNYTLPIYFINITRIAWASILGWTGGCILQFLKGVGGINIIIDYLPPPILDKGDT